MRSKLILWTVAGITGVLLVSGVILYQLVSAALLEQVDASLLNRARSVSVLVEQETDEIVLEWEDPDWDRLGDAVIPAFCLIRDAGGEEVFRSEAWGEELPPLAAPVPGGVAPGRAGLADGRRLRTVTLGHFPPVDPDEPPPEEPPGELFITVAEELAPVEAVLAQLRAGFIAVWLAAVAIGGGVIALLIHRGFRPLGRVVGEIEEIQADDLDRRLSPEGVPPELAPVIDRVNQLLRRLDEAFERERSFSANVAHELRTPLAGLRSTLEVALSRRRDAPEVEAAARRCLGIVNETQGVVENLLAMARHQAGAVEVHVESFDLPDLLRQCWRPFAPVADSKQLAVTWSLPPEGLARTDREVLRQIVTNLLDNATAYSGRAGPVTIGLEPRPGGWRIEVANTGCDLRPGDLDRVFEPFWRADHGRSATGRHAGLGLPLCRALSAALGGHLTVDLGGGGRFAAAVELPGSRPGNDPGEVVSPAAGETVPEAVAAAGSD